MDLIQLITRHAQHHQSNQTAFFAAVAHELLVTHSELLLLSEYDTLKHQLASIIKAQSDSPKLYPKSQSDNQQVSTEQRTVELAKRCKREQRILSCPQVDAHVLLLACLRGLNTEIPQAYTAVLKDILRRHLHKIEMPSFHEQHLIARESEINGVRTILARDYRHNVILTGPSGIGKTTLAQSMATHLTEFALVRVFPGGDNFFDQIVTILSIHTSPVVFFVDELPSFPLEHIAYLLEHGRILATANDTAIKKLTTDAPHILTKCELISLTELNRDALAHILQDKAALLMRDHPLNLEEGLIEECIHLCHQYIHTSAFPGKAIALLEEAIQTVRIRGESSVTIGLVRSIVSEKTHIPIASLTDIAKKDLSQLSHRLEEKVKGQKEAITAISKTIQRGRLGFKKSHKPIGSFLFVGPSGVGKTELAKAVAKEVFGDEEAMVRMDMSEYAESHAVQRMIGAPPGYVGFEEGGQLTNAVRKTPYTLVLLDEIEKAHPRIFDIFLQVLDDGRLTDGQGQIVDFRNTIIVATSNAGIEDMLDMIEEGKTHEQMEQELRQVLTDYFRIEFINRFDAVVLFNPLSVEALSDIVRLQVEKLNQELVKQQITLTVSDETIMHMAQQSHDPRYGARGVLRMIQDTIESKLADMLLQDRIAPGDTVAF